MKKIILCATIILAILLPAWSQEELPRIGVGLAMLLNILPGFGLGSFLQGDTSGGRVQLSADGVGWGWFASMVFVSVVIVDGGMWEGLPYFILGFLGWIPVLGGVPYKLIRPIYYRGQYQKQHQSEEVSIGIIPSITPSADRLGFDVGVEVTFRCRFQ